MPSPSLAEIYFRDLVAKRDGLFAHLDGLGAETTPTVETEWLDIKGSANLGNDEIRKY